MARLATVADAREILRVWNAYAAAEDYAPWAMEKVLRLMRDERMVFAVAEEGGAVAAFLLWMLPEKGQDVSCSQTLGSDPALATRVRLRAVRDVILFGFDYEASYGRTEAIFWARPDSGTDKLFASLGVTPAEKGETNTYRVHMPTERVKVAGIR